MDKITINDLTTDCGISRMAFYYHFKDIYDLVEWVCVEDGKSELKSYRDFLKVLGLKFNGKKQEDKVLSK